MEHWLQLENSLNFIKNMKYGYITSAVLHQSHRRKTALSKPTTL